MQCPGQDTRYWKPGAVFETTCPKCGGEMEFFKDEASRRCKKCGERMLNPKMDFGCASYCKYAEQCFGALPSELLAGREDLFKDRVAIAVKRYFGKDFKRIGHATRVARHAEHLGKQEQGNLAVILSAAYLHDTGSKNADGTYKTTDVRYQELEGPAVARQMLMDLGANPEMLEEVCDLINPDRDLRPEESLNFKVLHDADLLADLEEKHKENPLSRGELEDILAGKFLTASGRELAAKELSKCCLAPQS
ncbi:MAG: phosphohydrolase [Deltaproteobacteria bacterium]|nr:phosphohydrolase [Deltaproteobacteria bacterium]